MRREFALSVFLCTAAAFAQQPVAPNPVPGDIPPSSTPAVYYAGSGLTAPELIPPSVSISLPKRCVELDGVVKLSAFVDANGVPNNVKVLQSDNAHLNNFATALVASQKFKPGTYNGAPAPVAIELTAGLHTCAQEARHGRGIDESGMTLRSHPFIAIRLLAQPSAASGTNGPVEPAKGAAQITAPTPIFQPNPLYPKAAKRKKITGSCLVGATVDAAGVPQNVKIVTGVETSLDENAVRTIKTWRFNPALQDGAVPVPFEITIAVTYWRQEKLYLTFTTIVPKPSSAVISTDTSHSAKSITPPTLLNADEVQVDYSPYGQLARISGLCVVAFVVDTNGVPQNVRVVKSLESSMDENAVTAVQGLRFKPGIKDGTTPVPVEVIMPINFRLRIQKRALFESALTAAIFIFGI